MPAIICYHCFERFSAHEARFKCVDHKRSHDEHLGRKSPLIFDARPVSWPRSPPVKAPCPRDGVLSGFRVCPRCHRDLPYHAGRSNQRIVAVVGCQGVGKTLFLWSLLYRLREQMARQPHPLVATMFEDDGSFDFYHSLSVTLLGHRDLPEGTQAKPQKQDGIPPVVVRISGAGRVANLVFYDPAGELLHNLKDLRFLRYLEHAAAVIYLVDPVDSSDLEARRQAADGLSYIVTYLKQQGQQQKRNGLIGKALAVVVTKADYEIYPKHGQDDLLPTAVDDLQFWKRFGREERRRVGRSSDRCKGVLRELKHHHLLAVAENEFARKAYFTASSLGGVLIQGAVEPPKLSGEPAPIGVEHPLFWSLRMMR